MLRNGLSIVLALALCAACSDRTYVLVTVELDPTVDLDITELRFTSDLIEGSTVINTDERSYDNDGKPVAFPNSFVLLADRRGDEGEVIEVFAEGLSGDAAVARARGTALVVPHSETGLQLVLRSSCSVQTECLSGAFCDDPYECDCAGDGCDRGFCVAVPLDDGNPCTVSECTESEFAITHNALADGTECIDDEGATLQCAKGICKSPHCGDFIVDVGEDCDDGEYENSDSIANACRTDCRSAACGDGIVDDSEECDSGPDNLAVADGDVNVDDDSINESCRQSVVTDNGAGAFLSCRLPFCGDGIINSGERCDDHNNADSDGAVDGCNPTCTLIGEVSLHAGLPGGPGHIDGIGELARLSDVLDMAVVGGLVYFVAEDAALGFVDSTIRTFNPATGAVSTIAGTLERGDEVGAADVARFSSPRSLSAVGNTLFIADTVNHKIKSINLTTGVVSLVAGNGQPVTADGTLATATFALPSYIAARSADELLVMDRGNGCKLRHIKISADTVKTIAGGTDCNLGFLANTFGNVQGMVMGPDDYLYVADNHTIRRIDLSPLDVAGAVAVENYAGPGPFPFQPGDVDDVGAAARFNTPAGLWVDGTTLYVADLINDKVRTVDLTSATVDSLTTGPESYQPFTVAVTGQTLLVGNQWSNVLWSGDLSGSAPVSLSAVAGVGKLSGIDEFFKPAGLAVSPTLPGVVFIADENATVRRVAGAAVEDVAGILQGVQFSLGVDFLDGHLLATVVKAGEARVVDATLDGNGDVTSETVYGLDTIVPTDLAVHGDKVYVASNFDGTIVSLTIGQSALTVDSESFVGDSTKARAVIDGTLNTARLGAPYGIAACGDSLYFTESTGALFEGHVVRRIDLVGGLVETIAGLPTSRGYRDGEGTSAQFNEPQGIAVDCRDPARPSLYVADSGNNAIRQIDVTLDGNDLTGARVTTLAGSRLPGSIDGTTTAASFSRPTGIVFDPATGDLYVSDWNENVIRLVH